MNTKFVIVLISMQFLSFGVSHAETPVTSDTNKSRAISQHGPPTPPGEALAKLGVEVSESGLREGLQLGGLNEVYYCLAYIEEQKLYELLPDVEACMEKWKQKELSTDDFSHFRLASHSAIFRS